MKKRIRIICLLLVLAMMLGTLAACKEEGVKLSGQTMFKGEIVHIAKAPYTVSEKFPNSYIVYVKTEYFASEELAEVLVTENTDLYNKEDWRNILAQRLTGNQITAYTYPFNSDIDPMHPQLYVAQVLSVIDEDQ